MPAIRTSDRESPEISRMLMLETVPPVTTVRWLPRHKAQLVQAVEAELLSVEEVCNLYGLTVEEFAAWQRKLQRFGLRGLQVTRRCDRGRPFGGPLLSSASDRPHDWTSGNA